MLPIAHTIDCEPDAAGFFIPALREQISRVARQFMRNGVDGARAYRYAFDEVCDGEWFADLSDPG